MANITERFNSKGVMTGWKVTACVGRDDNGRQAWKTCTIKVDDARITKQTPKKRKDQVQEIANAWGREQTDLYKADHAAEDKNRVSFVGFVNNHWWPDNIMDGGRTPKSIEFYRYTSNVILDYFAPRNLQLKDIGGEEVKRFVKYMNLDARTSRGEPYSKTTVKHVFNTLRNIFEYAVRFEYVKSDPCKKLKSGEKPKLESKKIDYLSPEDSKRFLHCLDDDCSEAFKKWNDAGDGQKQYYLAEYRSCCFWRCFFNVLIKTGLRRGECLGLQWKDIDGDALILHVERNVTVDKSSPDKRHIGEPKNHKSRTVPISEALYSMLMKFRRDQEQRFGACLLPTAFIFSSAESPYKPTYPTEPTRRLRKFITKHNLPNVSPHDLRHTAATLAVEGGANVKQVQELLGHSDPEISMKVYIAVTEKAQRGTIEGIEKVIG